MKKLTKEDTIQKHRHMWNWIANENKKLIDVPVAACVDKLSYFIFHNILNEERPMWECYLCEYSMQQSYHDIECRCNFCLLDWSNNGEIEACTCLRSECVDGFYTQFLDSLHCNDRKSCANIAQIIANLPEK